MREGKHIVIGSNRNAFLVGLSAKSTGTRHCVTTQIPLYTQSQGCELLLISLEIGFIQSQTPQDFSTK